MFQRCRKCCGRKFRIRPLTLIAMVFLLSVLLSGTAVEALEPVKIGNRLLPFGPEEDEQKQIFDNGRTLNGNHYLDYRDDFGRDKNGNRKGYDGAFQCVSFARYIMDQCFGAGACRGKRESADIKFSGPEELKRFFQSLPGGTHIKGKTGKDPKNEDVAGHSFLMLRADEDGAIIYHANWGPDSKNPPHIVRYEKLPYDTILYIINYRADGLEYLQKPKTQAQEPQPAPLQKYQQAWLYEDSGSWCNVQTATDWNGQSYLKLYDKLGTKSLIYEVPENFSGRRADLKTPFMTIPFQTAIEITNDEKASYVYYYGYGNTLCRLPLKRSGHDSGQPEVRDFTLEGSPFVFTTFALAKDPDQILLASRESDRQVTVGLFSFSQWTPSGPNEPLRTWTCTFPEERNFEPLTTNEVGYYVVYEASTDRVWLVAKQSTSRGTGSLNYTKWFFHAPLHQGGALQPFYPEEEVPGWNDTQKFKFFDVNRYRRLVYFTDSDNPDLDYTSIAVYDAGKGGRMRLFGQLDSWKDSKGNRRPLKRFWSGGSSNSLYGHGSFTDSLSSLYAVYYSIDRNHNASFARLARFVPEQAVADGAPDPSEDGRKQLAHSVVLKALPFKGPEGYRAIGSRWEVYRMTAEAQGVFGRLSIRSYENQEPVYAGRNSDGSSSHRLLQALPVGDYVWRMAYDWQIEGEGGMKGSTRWSTLGHFTAVDSIPDPAPDPEPSPNPEPVPEPLLPDPQPGKGSPSGGGGCHAGAAGIALLPAALLFSRRKNRS